MSNIKAESVKLGDKVGWEQLDDGKQGFSGPPLYYGYGCTQYGENKSLPSPYHRRKNLTKKEIERGAIIMDCYDILDLVGITRSRMQHAAKKVLYAGVRGHKDQIKDIKEAIWSLQSELEILESQAK